MSNFAIIGDNPPGLERDTEGKAVMATQAGIGVLIGLGIGSGVTAFLMRRIIHRQDNALQQSITRIDRIQEEHAHELNAALEKMAVDYEQQLAAKIERYQDTHEVQLGELEIGRATSELQSPVPISYAVFCLKKKKKKKRYTRRQWEGEQKRARKREERKEERKSRQREKTKE